jgi:hypothetical protein
MWPGLSQLKQVKVALAGAGRRGSVRDVSLLARTNGPWAIVMGLRVITIVRASPALAVTCAREDCLSWKRF